MKNLIILGIALWQAAFSFVLLEMGAQEENIPFPTVIEMKTMKHRGTYTRKTHTVKYRKDDEEALVHEMVHHVQRIRIERGLDISDLGEERYVLELGARRIQKLWKERR